MRLLDITGGILGAFSYIAVEASPLGINPITSIIGWSEERRFAPTCDIASL